MSVINETLDNLKKPKKHGAAVSLDPSSSAYVEHTEKKALKLTTDKSFIIPLSLAVLVGVFFIAYHINTPTPKSQIKATIQDENKTAGFWRHATKPASNQPLIQLNAVAQGQYYTAMALLNEGKDAQALAYLKDIVKQYPDFAPAKNTYSMLSERSE